MNQIPGNPYTDKTQNSIINYKIVKCKNWEKDKTCKYGSKCTFAHGDNELRTKNDNIPIMAQPFPVMMPIMMDQNGQPIMMQPGPGFDYSQMQMQMMPGIDQNQFMMGMGMMPPQPNNPPNSDAEVKNEANGGNSNNQQ